MTDTKKQRALIIAPGRGSYSQAELGYFRRYANLPRGERANAVLERADELRREWKLPSVSELDAKEKFSFSDHLAGQNASSIIFSAALSDLALLSGKKFELSCVLGNSMGFYIALAVSGALAFDDAFRLVNFMGGRPVVGGQIIYPVVDEDWKRDPRKVKTVRECLDNVNALGADYFVATSIHLGGYEVLAGTDKGIKTLLETLPPSNVGTRAYPFQLAGHSAFHTRLMSQASAEGLAELRGLGWSSPKLPLIDGRGLLWRPGIADPEELRQYTLSTQVTEHFDFTAGLRLALREFGPDVLIMLGPGETLGGSIAQILIGEKWRGISDKSSFLEAQKQKPFLFNMGNPKFLELLLS